MPNKLKRNDVVFQGKLLAEIVADQIAEYLPTGSGPLRKAVRSKVVKAVERMWSTSFLEDNVSVSTAAQIEILEEVAKTALSAARKVTRKSGVPSF